MGVPRMLILMFVVSFTFQLVLSAMNDPLSEQITPIGAEDYNSGTIVEVKEPSVTDYFLGPLLAVWKVVESAVKFVNAPWIFLSEIGAPSEIKYLLGVPWTIAFIWEIASFVRGFKA